MKTLATKKQCNKKRAKNLHKTACKKNRNHLKKTLGNNQNLWQKNKNKAVAKKTCIKQDKIQLFVRKTKQNHTTLLNEEDPSFGKTKKLTLER